MRGTLRHVLACILPAVLAGSAAALAQCELEEPRPAKAQKLYERATSPKGKAALEDRLAWLVDAIELSPEDPELLMESAELTFKATRRDPDMWSVLTERLDALDEVCPGGMPEALYLRGAMAYINDAYEMAMLQFQAYLALPEDATTRVRRAEVERTLPDIVFLHEYHMHEKGAPPQPLPELSWDEDEYLPMLSPDGALIFFTRASVEKAKGDITGTRIEKFTWAQRANEKLPFDGGTSLEHPFNEGSNYGGSTISVNNKLMVIAAHNPTPKNPANIDLFSTEYHVEDRDFDGKPWYAWSNLEPLNPHVNSELGWEAQPSISGDGNTLFFAGARAESTPDADGNITMDIYQSTLQDNGIWGPAQKLPPPINSAFQDKAPFLHPDGRTLYFSSNRTPSGGGYDLWMSQRDSSGQWSTPVNMGLPLNSQGDEHGLVVATDGSQAFFSSRRPGTRGLDICTYSLPAALQPDPVTVVKGDLGWPLPEGKVTVNIEYVQSKRVEQVEISREDGTFAQVVKLEEGEDVVLTVEGDNIGYQSVVVHEQGRTSPSALRFDLDVRESDPTQAFILEDVQFKSKESTLDARSKVMLHALANHLERRPELQLLIHGHTDNIGEPSDNLALSVLRAQAVRDFLVVHGVELNRLIAEGFGETQPKSSNDDEAGRKRNRRTEFRWIQ